MMIMIMPRGCDVNMPGVFNERMFLMCSCQGRCGCWECIDFVGGMGVWEENKNWVDEILYKYSFVMDG